MTVAVSGIYAIRNTLDQKIYIGQSVSIWQRKKQHFHELRKGKHHCRHLQKAFDKYGEAAFEFVQVECCNAAALTEREQFWMDFYGRRGTYNSAPAAGSSLGHKHTEDAKRRMSEAQRKRPPPSAETRARRSASLTGKKRPESFSRKISAIHKGRVISAETRAKISATLKERALKEPHPLRGRKLSPEQCAAMSLARTGTKRPQHEKDKIAATLKGRVFSEEHRAKLSAALMGNIPAHKGQKRPQEVGARISAAKKGRPNGLLGKKLTEEHKQHMRIAQLRRIGKYIEATEPK
jgi:group I intron endonuclease